MAGGMKVQLSRDRWSRSNMHNFLLATIFLPVVGAFAAWLFSGGGKVAVRQTALVTSGITLVLIAYLVICYWIDGGLHATEVLGAQQLIETIYQFASKNDEETQRILKDVIILATHANPRTGERDLPLMKMLVSSFGQKEPTFAVGMVTSGAGGVIRVGDEVAIVGKA